MSALTDYTLEKGVISADAKYGFIPGLNGIRAFAVMIVLAAHLKVSSLIPGGFGVTLFFFISGFLITRLLIAERRSKGRIGLRQFYIRRFIRLYPALIFMLGVSTAVFWLSGLAGPSWLEMFAGVFYFSNIFQLLADMGQVEPVMAWRPLWSLAVEEHFYLFFPAFMVILGAFRKRFVWGMLILLILVPLWRTTIAYNDWFEAETYTYMMTDTRIDSILWGCLLSTLLDRQSWHAVLKRLIGWVPVLTALGALLFTFLFRDEMFRMTFRFSLQGAALFVLILNLYFFERLSPIFKILELKFLSYLGILSYGLYLWHFPILDWLLKITDSGVLSYGLTPILSFIFAHVSYRFVETPFISLRKRFGAHIVHPKTTGE